MEHDKPQYSTFKEKYDKGIYSDLIEILQTEVNRSAKIQYPNCYDNDLWLYISRLFDKSSDKEKIILTINHSGYMYSRYLFPQENSFYGLNDLASIISDLYNQTM